MYDRKGLKGLAEELERQRKSKRDYVVDTRFLTAKNVNGILHLEVKDLDEGQGTKTFSLTEYAHEQLAAKCDIPVGFYNKLNFMQKTDLLAHNVNELIVTKERRLLRTLDGRIRAVVSDRYKCLDNTDVFFMTLEKFKEHGVELLRADLTERHMFVKGIIGKHEHKVTDFDILKRGIMISNSEVGAGAFRVEPFLWRLSCENGMIGEFGIRKFHLGERLEVGEIFTDETIAKSDEALWLKVRDVVDATFDDEFFEEWVANIKISAETEVVKPTRAVEYIVREYGMPKQAKEDLLDFFAMDKVAGNSVWGLSNAVTRFAKGQGRADIQVDFERLGAKLLNDKELLAVATGK